MKTLHLIRHAKSCWENPELSDLQRPLHSRGVKACKLMAAAIAEAGCVFDHIFVSPAKRTQMTIELLSEALPEMKLQWQTDDALYTFKGVDLLHWCQSLDDGLDEVVVVGHNPALTDVCNGLSDADLQNIPTAGYVQLAYDGDNWADLTARCAKLTQFLTPKIVAS